MSATNGHAAVLISPNDEVTHAYVPRDVAEPWGLCSCGLAEAAHLVAREPYEASGEWPSRS
jgi:hypothetical protein